MRKVLCRAGVQVVVRLRPLNPRELAANETEAIRVSFDEPHTLQVPSTTASIPVNLIY